MAFNDVNVDGKARLITLTFGHMEGGGHYWCYVAVKPSRYDEFMKLSASNGYNIQHFVDDGFGEVIVSGEGISPPMEVTREVARIFSVPLKELFAQVNTADFIAARAKMESGDSAQS